MSLDDLVVIMLEAYNSPHGLLIKTNDPQQLQQLCYRATKKFDEVDELRQIQAKIVTHEDGNLTLTRRSPHNGQSPTNTED